jgi:transposase InsO family protein
MGTKKQARGRGGPCPQRARRYDAQTKQDAVSWAQRHGAAAAAAKFGMSERSVQLWQQSARPTSAKVIAPAPASVRATKAVAPAPASVRTTKAVASAPTSARATKAIAPAPASVTAATATGRAAESKAASSPARSKVSRAVRRPGTDDTTRSPAERARHGRRYGVAEKQAILVDAQQLGVTAAAVKHGVSRWSMYEWRRRQVGAKSKAAAATALVPRSSRPHRSPNKLAEERYHLIAETWLANQALGPRQIRNQLRRTHALRVGTSTVRRVLEEQGYVPPKIKVERRVARRYEAVRPNQQWHLDFIQFYVHKARVYLLLIEDDYSRFLVGHRLCEGERAQSVCEAVEEAIARHGKPEVMVVDGGSGFFSWRGQSQLERLCGDYGIDFVKAHKLGGNSKLEALNANVRKELLSRVEFADLTDAAARSATWVRTYNLERVHEGLGGLLVPADRYFGRAEEVLAAIERGQPVGASASIAERALDLFRVKYVGGKPELWLLGERIWPAGVAS